MRSVLITGGTGSLGRAITKKLLSDKKVERIAIFSRGEVAQAEMSDELSPIDPEMKLRFFIGDVRDENRVRRAFEGVDTVIHAAALKRIEVGYYNPEEMVKTNIVGSMNVINGAIEAGIEKAVLTSTDKAYRPVSSYGQSKALAETLFINANNMTADYGPIFSVTRYGNVSGSRGSVIPKWAKILETSRKVPITDPDATRFWMDMSEAVDLVLKTAENNSPGPINIPTLPSYRMGDLAIAMGATEYEITGLPHWEKMHEGLRDGFSSGDAPFMTVAELRGRLTMMGDLI